MQRKDGKRVVLGMSGGVDSSVACVLLKEQGYDVIGIFMKNWDEEDENCTQREDYLDVVRVCGQLDVPYFTVNFEKEYKERVFSYFLEEYRNGRTPNPDVLCNTEIKFKAFLDHAMKLDADFIAMGHYVRVLKKDNRAYLLRGVDENKDQSYFLSRVSEEALKKSLFPVGELKKYEVRKIAKDYNLTTALKKDSTGICFVGERDFNEFLDKFLFSKPGEIYSCDGEYLGRHSGLMHYTIGQRRGLGIGGRGSGEPFFVQSKDLDKNILYVAQGENNPLLYESSHELCDLFWINDTPSLPLSMSVKIRYRAKDVKATLKNDSGKIIVYFEKPLKGVTPGQVCVFYDKDVVLGSGIFK